MNQRTVVVLILFFAGAMCLLVALGGVTAVFAMFNGEDDDDDAGGSGSGGSGSGSGNDDGDGGDDDDDGDDDGDEDDGDEGEGEGEGEGVPWVKPITLKAYGSHDCSGIPKFTLERSPPMIAECADMPVTTTSELAQKLRCEADAEKVPRSTVTGEFTRWDRVTNQDYGEICCIETENVDVAGVHDAEVTPAVVSSISGNIVIPAEYDGGVETYYNADDKHATYRTVSEDATTETRECMKNYRLVWSARV